MPGTDVTVRFASREAVVRTDVSVGTLAQLLASGQAVQVVALRVVPRYSQPERGVMTPIAPTVEEAGPLWLLPHAIETISKFSPPKGPTA